jgi:hypothetical protein
MLSDNFIWKSKVKSSASAELSFILPLRDRKGCGFSLTFRESAGDMDIGAHIRHIQYNPMH